MIIVYKEGQHLQDELLFFQETKPNSLPFVDTTLGNVSVSGWRNLGAEKIYAPESWNIETPYKEITEIPLEEKDLAILTTIDILPLSLPEFIEDREILVANNVSIGKGFKSMGDFLLGKTLKTETFESINYSLDSLIELVITSIGGSVYYRDGSSYTEGSSVYDDDSSITNSSIHGPCLIFNSTISNSVVYPGSVIINSNIVDSTVQGSYISSSRITKSSLKDTISYRSTVNKLKLTGSRLPNSNLDGENEKEIK